MPDRIFVPLVTVHIHPAKNAERPAIEGTTRSCQCPPYEVPLIKAKWSGPHAQSITVTDMVQGANPLYELLPRDGKTVVQTEEKRLMEKWGQATYFKVYRDGDLEAKILECAEKANEYLDQVQQKDAERSAVAAEKAAAALIKESQKSVAEAFAKAEKRGPGRPRKVTQEPASADA